MEGVQTTPLLFIIIEMYFFTFLSVARIWEVEVLAKLRETVSHIGVFIIYSTGLVTTVCCTEVSLTYKETYPPMKV
jgi:hypothetical protein